MKDRETTALIYLSSSDVAALDLPLEAVEAALETALVDAAGGDTVTSPKGRLQLDSGRFFMSMHAASKPAGRAAVKWIGCSVDNAERNLPTINALIVVNDIDTGRPIAIMDGTWITTVRTAALSAVAARRLLRKDSETLGFLGCGVQAHSHLEALSRLPFPRLKTVTAFSRSAASAEAVVVHARRLGFAAEIAPNAETLVREADVVVSALPASNSIEPIADAAWLKPGATVLGVDLGRAWRRDNIAKNVDLFVTDSREQTEKPGASQNFAYPGPFGTDLGELVTARHPGRVGPEERIMFLFGGLAIADLAVAGHLLDLAKETGKGTQLPL